MAKVPLRRELSEPGSRGRIWGIEDGGGECQAEVFLSKLDVRARGQFRARFKQIAAVGTLRTPDMFRWLKVPGKPTVGEIKVEHGPGWRLYVVRQGIDWYATHGTRKPKERQIGREIAKAREVFAEGEA